MNDEVEKEKRRRLIAAQVEMDEKRAIGLKAAQGMYVNHRKALQAMRNYLASHGESALIKKLQSSPNDFGGTKGHIGSGDFLKPKGFGDRRIAAEIAATLPGIISDIIQSEKKFNAAQDSLELGRAGRNMGKEGIEFP